MAGTSTFAATSRLHTFTSGRVAEVRDSISYTWLMTRVMREEPELEALLSSWANTGEVTDEDGKKPDNLRALQLVNLLVHETWVRPHIRLPDDDEPDGVYGDDWCNLSDLHDSEVDETLELTSLGVRQVATFPVDTSSPESGDDREVLGDKPRKSPGSAKRKR